VLRHLEENICEAGSLVRRVVFAAGARFDESMKLGFEDWDFWLTAVELGFRGRHLDNFGLRYRKRPESMVRDSDRDRLEITSYIQRKHKPLFEFDSLHALEHREAPRYGIFKSNTGCVALTSDPNVEGRRLGLEDFFDEYYRAKSAPMRYSRPAFVIVTQTALLDCLRQFRLSQWIFWYLETLVELSGVVHLAVRNDAGSHRIEVKTICDPADTRSREPAGLVIVKTELLDRYLDSGAANGIMSLAADMTRPNARLVELALPDDRDLPSLAPADATLHTLLQRMQDCRSRLYQGANWNWRENSLLLRTAGDVVIGILVSERQIGLSARPVPERPLLPIASRYRRGHRAQAAGAPAGPAACHVPGSLGPPEGAGSASRDNHADPARGPPERDWRVIGDTVIDGTVPPELEQLRVEIEPAKLTQDELTECYGWADVVLILSRWEGLPLTIVEAMRVGVVVCATTVGAVAEAVSQEETGFLLPSAGTAAIAAAAARLLQRLCQDRRALNRVSLAAALAMKDWTWETTAHDFVSRLDQRVAA